MKPQYDHVPASNFLSARAFGARGDGATDDTAALNALFAAAAAGFASGTVAFVDAGYYLVSDTVSVPPDVRIVGEALASVVLGSGPNFSDMGNPRPVVRVGRPGDSGYVEVSDLIVSTRGGTAGAVLLEYNLDTPAATACGPGSPPSGLWDVHVRVGGFAGSELQVAQCPKATPGSAAVVVDPACVAAYLSMHVTRSAGNLYVENGWVWVADHDVDDAAETQISVYAGRGLLVESARGRVWLVATSVEHHVLYQYQLVATRDVWMGHIQSETPYFQPNPPAPYPFAARDVARHDPDFASDCRAATAGNGNGTLGGAPCFMAWGLRVLGSRDVVVFGAGLYSFFNDYSTDCSALGAGSRCQARIFWAGPTPPAAGWDATVDAGADAEKLMSLEVYTLNTVGSVSAITRQGVDVALYSDGVATFASTVALFRY